MLQELSYLLGDNVPQIITAVVMEVEEGEPDLLLVKFKALPDGNEFVAPVTWGPGVFEKPLVDDIAIVVLVGKDMDQCHAISFLPRTSTGWLIPQRTINGEMVLKSRAGQKLNISSDTRVNIGTGGDTEESQPLVLGTVLHEYLGKLITNLDTLIGHITTVATGLNTLALKVNTLPGGTNAVSADIAPLILPAPAPGFGDVKKKIATDDKSTYITTASSNILSQIAFTERGGS